LARFFLTAAAGSFGRALDFTRQLRLDNTAICGG
jgi:hypothetical protein